MKAISSDCLLHDEDFATATAQINSIMNNRPITRLSDDPNDIQALSPAQLMSGAADVTADPAQFLDPAGYRRSFRNLKTVVDAWWSRWVKDYITMLQQRQKWLKPARNLEIGDLVLMTEKNIPRGLWRKALVTKTYPDKWGVVRTCTVTTATGTKFNRECRQLVLLEASTT